MTLKFSGLKVRARRQESLGTTLVPPPDGGGPGVGGSALIRRHTSRPRRRRHPLQSLVQVLDQVGDIRNDRGSETAFSTSFGLEVNSACSLNWPFKGVS